MNKISNTAFAEQARSEKYTGVPYDKLDCQAFAEEVLKDCGIRKPDGTPYNWRGVNSMWRNAFTWKGTIQEAIEKYGSVPLGAWAIIWKNDGGEKERGYNDGLGNAKHVGIVTGENTVRDSTRSTKTNRNGVGYRPLSDFTHIGLPYMIEYNIDNAPVISPDKAEALKALETIKQFIEGRI